MEKGRGRVRDDGARRGRHVVSACGCHRVPWSVSRRMNAAEGIQLIEILELKANRVGYHSNPASKLESRKFE